MASVNSFLRRINRFVRGVIGVARIACRRFCSFGAHADVSARAPALLIRAAIVSIALLAASATLAAPYNGQPFSYQQPDGSEITVYVFGDEFLAYGETEDGYIVQKDPKSGFFCYAKIKPDGSDVISTGVRVGRAKPPGLKPKLRLPRAVANAKHKSRRELLGFDDRGRMLPREELEKELTQLAAEEEGTKTEGDTPPIVMAPPSVPTVNKRVSLVLLASFPDRPGDVTIPQSEVDDFSNATGYTGNGNATSIRGYFLKQSNNRFDYSSVVTAWFTAANPRDYYTTDQGVSFGNQARWLITEGLQALVDDGFDFTLVDGDSDGDVDGINCFYAGSVVNQWADNFGLWPHSSSSTWGPLSGVPGLTSASSKYQITAIGSGLLIGTWLHENGHMICNFPDLYSYNGNAANLGYYSLMSSGNYAGGQKHPTSIDPYLKYHAGWMDLIDLDNTSHQRCVVQVDGNQTYRYQKPGDSLEYFLFEVRDNTGYEGPYGGHLASVNPDTGLLIWHGKQNGSSTYGTIFTADNPADYTKPYEAFVVEANPATATNPWYNDPTPNGNDAFKSSGVSTASDSTTPSLKFWDATGRNTSDGVDVHSVSADGPVMTFVIGSGAPVGAAAVELSRSTIDTFCNFGGTAGAELFYIINSQAGTLNYNVSDNATWLSCDVATGSATTEADPVNVTFSTSGLSAGSYTGTITVDDGGAGSKTITVNLTVYPQPTMELGSTNIEVFGFAGMSGAQGSFTLRNIGGGEMSYSVSSTQAWFSPSPSSGSVIGEVDTIYADCDATSLSAGTYYDTVTITSAEANNSPLTVDVTFIVQSTDMIVTYPDGGETLSGNTTATITWSSSLGGNVQIDLYKGGSVDQVLAANTLNDGSFDWAVPFGMYGTNYQIRITSIEQPSKDDYSNGDFTIATCDSFESDLDGWIQETGDNLDWTRQSGSTPSRASNTGPIGASDGLYYLFTESSSPNYNYTVNIYKDFDFSSLNKPLVMFDYHMYGAAMGSLYFEVSTNSGSTWATAWSLSGNQGDVWVTTNVDLTAYANMASVRLRFRGVTGSSFTSDMAFDRVCIIENAADGIRFVGPFNFAESTGVATVVVERVGDTVGAISVDYATSDGTATAGSDYTASSGTLNWGDGDGASKSFTVPILNDGEDEASQEFLTITLSNPVSTTIMGVNPITLTIQDDDNVAPVVNAGTNQTVYLSGEVPWSPADTTTLAWYDAADTNTLWADTVGGTPATTTIAWWEDKSGNNRHLEAPVSNRPDTGGTINGVHAITAADGDYFSVASFGAGTYDIFFVMRGANSGNTVDVSLGGNNNDSYLGIAASADTVKTNVLRINTTNEPAGAAILFNGETTQSVSTRADLYNEVGTQAFLVRFANIPVLTSPIKILEAASTSWEFVGDAGEILFVASPAPEEVQKLEGYLAHKWGLATNLPPTHPYKETAPGSPSATAVLDGTVTDSAPDMAVMTSLWTLFDGPVGKTVDFADAAAVDTTATFHETGVYTLRLTADDGEALASDDVVITVAWAGFSLQIDQAAISENGGTSSAALTRQETVGDLVVTLSSSDVTEATVPPSVTILDGQTTATFTITAQNDAILDGTQTVTITGTAAGFPDRTDTIDILDSESVVTYVGNGSTVGSPPTDPNAYEFGDTVTVLGQGTMTKAPYLFGGWNTAADGSGTLYAEGNTFTISSNTTLYAVWNPGPLAIYEPFAQTVGSLSGQPGGTGLSGTWGISGTVNVVSPATLSYGNLPNESGQVELTTSAGTDAWITTNPDLLDSGLLSDGATLWFSFVYQKTSGGGGNEHGGFAFGTERVDGAFNGTQMINSGYGVGFYTRNNSISVATWNGSGAPAIGSSLSFAYSNSVFVVGKVEWGATSNDVETVTLYTPSLTDLGNLGVGVSATVVGFDQTALDTISFTDRGSLGTQTYDEFRFGSSYESVIGQSVATSLSVTYNGNGSDGGAVPVDSTEYQASDTVTVLGNTGNLVRTGYTFDDWNTAANGSGTPYASTDTFTISVPTTLYAQWLASTATVTFDKQSGSGGSASVLATYGSPMPAATAPTRAGYLFGGYYTGVNGTSNQYYTAAMASARNWDLLAPTTLYAKWTASYTVTFQTDGTAGATLTGSTSQTVPAGTDCSAVTANAPAGYHFVNWTKAGTAYSTANPLAVVNVTETMTLVANFIKDPTITISDDGLVTEGAEAGEVILVTLADGTFADPITPANWTLAGLPAGVTKGAVTRLSDTIVQIALSGNRTVDYDSDITGMSVTCAAAEVGEAIAPLSANSGVTFSAINDAESIEIADDGWIQEGAENGELITVVLNGGTFASSLNAANWTVANLPAGVAKGAVTRVSDTVATIALSGNRTGTYGGTDITNVTVTCTTAEYADSTGGASLIDNTGVRLRALTSGTLILQDGLDGYAGTRDTYIDVQNSTVNYGTATSMLLGSRPSPAQYKYGFLYFDLTALATNAVITGATLDFTDDGGSANVIRLVEATGSWTETGATYNNSSTLLGTTEYATATTPGAAGTAVPSLVLSDPAGVALVQGWVNAPASNYGFAIKTDETGNGLTVNLRASEHATQTNRPKLTLTYEGGASAPEINIQGKGISIVSGDMTPTTADDSDFGDCATGGDTVVRTFTVQNHGNAALNLSGTPIVDVIGANASDFAVTVAPATNIAASGSTTFQVTFTPGGLGSRTATISIANNDADENPYTFAVQGKGIGAPVTYTVSYDGNTSTGGTAPVDLLSPYESGATVVVLGAGDLAKTGYTFTNWNTQTNGTGTGYAPAASFTITSNTSLYAQWTLVPVSVVTDLDSVNVPEGGTGSFQVKLSNQPAGDVTVTVSRSAGDADISVQSGSTLTFTTTDWDTYQTVTLAAANDADAANGTATIFCDASDAAYTDKNVTANEVDKHTTLTVTNDGNGVTAPSGAVVVAKGVATNITATANEGYDFTNWSVPSGTATIADTNAAATSATISTPSAVQANFVLKTYTVSYNANGADSGTVPPAQPKTHGVNLTLASNSGGLARVGYAFAGWNTASGGTGTDYADAATYIDNADMVLFAKWLLNVPDVPTGLVATAYVGRVELSWSVSANTASSVVKRASVSGGPFAPVGTTVTTTFDDTTVANGGHYFYVVAAGNAAGMSAESTEVEVQLPVAVPFADDFEALPLGDLDGQNNWTATNAVVQTNVVHAGVKAAFVSDEGFIQQDFAPTQTNVWTDFRIQPAFLDGEPGNLDVDSTAVLYFNTNGHPVVYDGATPVVLGTITVSTGEWVRVSVQSDYVAKTWSLYINTLLAMADLDFYDTNATHYTQFSVKGGGSTGAAVDSVAMDTASPFVVPSYYLLTVYSDHGTPTPDGVSTNLPGSTINAAMADATITNSGEQYVCTGWTGSGSGLTSGTQTNFTFAIMEDTTLTWQWTTNYWVELEVAGE